MSSGLRIGRLVLSCLLVAVSFSFTSLSWAAAPSNTLKLRGVYSSESGAMTPMWVAQEAGLFTKHGLELSSKYLASTTAVQALVGGGEDVCLAGNQGIDANLAGADLVYVAAGIPTFVFHLYADPGITSVADLRGKVVAATQASAPTDYAARITLSRSGLVPEKDVRVLYAGNMPALLSAIKSGNAAAGVLSAPSTIQAKALGLKEIVNITNLKIPFLFIGVLVPRSLTRENSEALTRYLRGHIEAIAVIRRDKETTMKALGKYLKTENHQVLESVYEEYAEVFPKIPLITVAEVKAALDVAINPRSKQAKPEDFFDNSFVQKIQASEFIDSLYSR